MSVTTTDETKSPIDAALPTEVSIKGTLSSDTKAIHYDTPSGLGTLIEAQGTDPTLSPKPASGATPALSADGIVVTILSPEPKSCKASVNFVYNLNEVSVSIAGEDTDLSNADCAAMIDAIPHEGFEATVSNVPWNDAPTSAPHVTVHVSIK
jgi:hypothetical protein